MKNTDFSKLGGMPITQQMLAFWQAGWTEGIMALMGLGYRGTCIITGCAVTNVSANYTIAPGWIVFNGQAIRVPGNTVTLASGNSLYIQITSSSNATALPWENASTPSVLNDVTAALSQQTTGTADTGTEFALDELGRWQPYASIEARADFNGDTIDFRQSRTIIYGGTSTGFTLNFDFNGAVPGTEINFYAPASGAIMGTTFASPATFKFINTGSGQPASLPNAPLAGRLKFLGLLSGTNYISFEMWNVSTFGGIY